MDDRYVASYETAILPVFEWVKSNEWMASYLAYRDDFYDQFAEAFHSPVSDILSDLPTPLWGRAMRCVFDDFLTVEYESSPSNVPDHYIAEVTPDLEKADIDFLQAFRDSFVRVYFVLDRTPHESVILREMSGGTRPIQIEDEFLTAAISPGDHIATRILTINDQDYLAGPVLVLSDDDLETFKQTVESAFKEAMRGVEKHLQKDLNKRAFVRQNIQKAATSILSVIWVASTFTALAETPPFANEDDPDTLFQAVIYYTSNLEQVVELLDAHPDLDRPIPKEFLWVWHSDREDPEASLKAMVWISGSEICLESCEFNRIEEAVDDLTGLLGDFVEDVTIEEISSDPDEMEEDEPWMFPEPMPGEEESAFRIRLHQYLDHQFRLALDCPEPNLGEKVPRELAKTVKGRKQLRKWLISLEAGLRENLAQIGLVDYDFGWMWTELGMESERQSSLFEG